MVAKTLHAIGGRIQFGPVIVASTTPAATALAPLTGILRAAFRA